MINHIERQFDDQIHRAVLRWKNETTDFMPISQAKILEKRVPRSELYVHIWGGWKDAERVQISIGRLSETFQPSLFNIRLMQLRGNFKFVAPTHRDFLGAIMSLGFVREKIGDILLTNDGCQFFLVEELVDYVKSATLMVKHVPVSIEVIPFDDFQEPVIKTVEKNIFINSLRLDGVVAHGFGISRQEADNKIRMGAVFINHLVEYKKDRSIFEGDLLSVRGLGKIRIGKVNGMSQKGKKCLSLFKFI